MSQESPFSPILVKSESAEASSFRALLKKIRRHTRWILLSGTVGSLVLCGLIFGLYQEHYTSESIVVLKNNDKSSGIINEFRAFSAMADVNPFKSQETLLKSDKLLGKVYQELSVKHLNTSIRTPEALRTVLDAHHIRGTEFIKLTASAQDPQMAQQIAEVYLDVYRSLSQGIDRASLDDRKKTLEKQMASTQQKLEEKATILLAFQDNNNVLDITAESVGLIQRMENLQQQFESNTAQLAEKQAQKQQLQDQLQLDSQSALMSVAAGQDKLYNDLIAELNSLEDEYQTKSVFYMPTHPVMQKLQERKKLLQQQMEQEFIQAVGLQAPKKKAIIKDSVRMELVGKLAHHEVDYMALKSKQRVLENQIKNLASSTKDIPGQQVEYTRLSTEIKNLRLILDKLEQGMTEVTIGQAARNLFVYAEPSLPKQKAFPNKLHLLMLAFASCFVLPVAGVATRENVKHYHRPKTQYLENVLQIPVLGEIPWLAQEPQSLTPEELEETYQNLAMNLQAQKKNLEKCALVVSATKKSWQKHPRILMNLALCLAQGDEKVLVIDGLFPSDKSTEPVKIDNLASYQAFMAMIDVLQEQEFDESEPAMKQLLDDIEKQITWPLHNNLFHWNIGQAVEKPYELFHSIGFNRFIALLGKYADWVFFDVPAILQRSSALALLKNTDGLLLLVEEDADQEQVELAVRKVHQVNSTVCAAILHE